MYRAVFANLEKKWDRAVQRRPREGETADEIAAAQANPLNDEEIEVIEVEIELPFNWGGGDAPAEARAPPPAPVAPVQAS